MIKGIGVDIIDLSRLDLNNKRFIERVLTKKEQLCFNQLKHNQAKKEYLGGRFAAKEAYVKARKTGIGPISFQDIEVLNDEFGAPYINDKNAQISISHEKSFAIAFVVIEAL